MFVDLPDPETERRHREKAGLGIICEEFTEVKQHLIFSGFDSDAMRNGVVELSARAKPAFGDPGPSRFKPPYLDTQAFGRASACNIDRMNRYSASHFVSHPLAYDS
jgi:hypothetical protein